MLKKLIIPLVLFAAFTTTYAGSTGLLLTKSQQNRLNTIVKQLKIPFGEYKLTIQSSGSTIENLISSKTAVQVVEKEKIVTETRTIEVPKEVIKEITIEKILPDPRVTTGSVILTPSDIEIIRSCGRKYGWIESLEVKAKRGECLENFFLQKGGVYLEI